MKQHYGIKLSTLLNAADKLSSDLEYLCSMIEQPDAEFPILDAVTYASSVMIVSQHLTFILEDLADRDLSEDEMYVKLTEEDVMALDSYTNASEETLEILEETCGIYLQSN